LSRSLFLDTCAIAGIDLRNDTRLPQGAERKTRDEERRAAKRKMTATGRKKLDELYHSVTERSEFYSMVDLHKPPVLFSPPAEHAIDKVIAFFSQTRDSIEQESQRADFSRKRGLENYRSNRMIARGTKSYFIMRIIR